MSISLQTEYDLFQIIEDSKRCVIKFGASWCPPCQKFASQFEHLAEINNDITFVDIDIDEFPNLAGKFNVVSLPTFVFVKNKHQMDKQQGVNVEKIKSAIKMLRV